MSKRKKFRRPKPGAAPGTIREQAEEYSIRVIAYGPGALVEQQVATIDEAHAMAAAHEVVWIDIVGTGNSALLKRLSALFGLHALSIEDVVHTSQRAKWERYDGHDYYVMRMVSELNGHGGDSQAKFQSEQLSLFHVGKFVISIQEVTGDCLEPLRQRIRGGKGFARKRSADYLVYAIIDMVIDYYFPVVDQIGEKLDEIDADLMSGGVNFSAEMIHRLRGQLIELGRWLRPVREMVNQILRDDATRMAAETHLFMRDCYDHAIQLSESIESYREICSDLRAYHLAAVSNRTNDVMKTLTIVSSIFIPLGFLAGLYGMNFDNMPELHWRWSYYALLATMLTVAGSLMFWFRRRGWFD